MKNCSQMLTMGACAIIWVSLVFVVVLAIASVFSVMLHRRLNVKVVRFACYIYLIWLLCDVVALYAYGTASTFIRSAACLLVMQPDDFYESLATVRLLPSQSKYVLDVYHKYDTGYLLGVGDPECRGNLSFPYAIPLQCQCVFRNDDGAIVFTKRIRPENIVSGKGFLDLEYDTFEDVPARRRLTVEIEVLGDIKQFCKFNPGAQIYVRRKSL